MPVGGWRLTTVVILTAVVVRAAAALHIGVYTPPYDAATYIRLAESVASGAGLVVDNEIFGDGLRAFFPPGYPLLLAAFGLLFGTGTWAITLLNTLIDLAAAWAIVRLGQDLKQPYPGFAAAVYLFWPAIVLSAPIAQKEGLTVLLASIILRSFVALDLVGIWFEFADRHRFFILPILLLSATPAIAHVTRHRRSAGVFS